MSLYQKYRPKDFDDLVGQQFIRRALTSALQKQKTVSVYLFCGSRGTGKTSVARILAKATNCLNLREDGNPCDECANCKAFADGTMLDIVEIDGASNNGVANVRELIERARFQPSYGKYKVYIIDEVHMLSTGAFNALLKTLEEPPEHVKFILATTEFHKIPETIVSRSQRYDFRKISDEDIVARLQYIAGKEGIEPEETALQLIAQLARGGLRDAISLFEQYSVGGVLSYEFIRDNLSIVGAERLQELTDTILANDVQKLSTLLGQLKTESIEPRRLLEQYLYFLRERAFAEMSSPNFPRFIRLFEACTTAYGKMKEFPNGFLLLEMTLLGQIQTAYSEAPTAKPAPVAAPVRATASAPTPVPTSIPAPAPVREAPAPATKTIIEPTVVMSRVAPSEEGVAVVPGSAVIAKASDFSFLELVNYTKKAPKKGVLLIALKAGTFKLEDDPSRFTLYVSSEFTKNQLDTAENKEFLASALRTLFGMEPEIRFAVDASKTASKPAAKPLDAKEASDIF